MTHVRATAGTLAVVVALGACRERETLGRSAPPVLLAGKFIVGRSPGSTPSNGVAARVESTRVSALAESLW